MINHYCGTGHLICNRCKFNPRKAVGKLFNVVSKYDAEDGDGNRWHETCHYCERCIIPITSRFMKDKQPYFVYELVIKV